MPLISPLPSDHDAEVAELAKFFNETLGFPPNSVLTMQRRPAIAKAFIELNKAVMENHGRVTSEQKRLIGYLTSASTGCKYCQAHTILAAQRYGGSDARLHAIWDFRGSNLFSATCADTCARRLYTEAPTDPQNRRGFQGRRDHRVASRLI